MVGSSSTSPFASPRRGRLSNPLGLSLSLGVTPGPANELGVAKKLRLYAQPLMEIVTMPSGQDHVKVHRAKEVESEVLNIQLHRGSRLRVLEMSKMGSTLRRAHIVLKGQSSPIGWITIWSKDGTHPVVRSVYARPLYEVVSPPLVRKQFETCSKEVCLLPVGTKLQVVESRRNSQGHQRVCIVVMGEDQPLGWITARRNPGQREGWVSIREVASDDPLLFSPGASPPNSRPASSRGRSKSPRNFDGWLRGLSASAREQGHANFAQAIAQARAKKDWNAPLPNSPNSPPKTPTPRRSPQASPREPRPSIFNVEAYKKEREAAAVNIAAPMASTAEGDKGKGDGDKETNEADRAKAKAASAERALRRDRLESDNGPLMGSSELEVAIELLQSRIRLEEDKLDPSRKSLSVLIGEGLIGAHVKTMVQSWAKRGSEPLNKLEFRQHVRKLLDQPDSKQIDALFVSLDDDGGGTLDIAEISSALKKFQQAAVEMQHFANETNAKIARIVEVRVAAKEAFDSTTLLEDLNKQFKELSANPSVAARLGAQIISKRMKVSDVITKVRVQL